MADDPFAQYAVTKDDPFAAYAESKAKPSQPMLRSRTGALYTPPAESGIGDAAKGFAENFDPRGLIGLAESAYRDPSGTAKAVGQGVLHAPAAIASDVLNNPAHAIGNATGMLATAGLMKGAGRLLTKAAPEAMDMGLQRTMAQRLEFPNTPQRLVDEGIVPRGKNVQNALSATEGRINSQAAAFDAAHPVGAGSPVFGTPPGRVDPNTIAQQAQGSAYNAGKVGGLGNVPGPEDAELGALKDRYLAQNTRTRGLAETIEQKRAYQARAKYDNRPNAPAVTNNELNFNKGIASANREAAIGLNPALEGDLAKERDLLGALTAQELMDAKSTPLSTVGTAKTLLGLRNPTVMGSAGIALDRTGRAVANPMAIRAALLAQLMASHQPENP